MERARASSDLRKRVDRLKAGGERGPVFDRLRELAEDAAASIVEGKARDFVDCASKYGRGLEALGRAADAPIFLPAFLGRSPRIAREERAAFLPSGAGGGDVAVWLGMAPPSAAFERRAAALSLCRLTLSIDQGGVRTESPS